MTNDTFFIPLAKTPKGIDILDTVWRLLYGSNEEKTNRFDDGLTQSTMCLLFKKPAYYNDITMVRAPVYIRDRCTIAVHSSTSDAECIYVMPRGGDTSQCGPEYLEYPALRKIMSSSIAEFKKARALSAKTKTETKVEPDPKSHPEPMTSVLTINIPVSNAAVIKTTTASPVTPVTPDVILE